MGVLGALARRLVDEERRGHGDVERLDPRPHGHADARVGHLQHARGEPGALAAEHDGERAFQRESYIVTPCGTSRQSREPRACQAPRRSTAVSSDNRQPERAAHRGAKGLPAPRIRRRRVEQDAGRTARHRPSARGRRRCPDPGRQARSAPAMAPGPAARANPRPDARRRQPRQRRIRTGDMACKTASVTCTTRAPAAAARSSTRRSVVERPASTATHAIGRPAASASLTRCHPSSSSRSSSPRRIARHCLTIGWWRLVMTDMKARAIMLKS